MSRRPVPAAVALPACLACALLVAHPALAERTEPLPQQLAGVGVTEHPDARLPLDRVFRDEEGREVRLRDFFDGRRPVILNLGYYACPMLCGLVANGMLDGMKRMDWSPGAEYRVVSLSIDPRENQTLAILKKQNYLKGLGRPSAAAGWSFLTGLEPDIRAVTDAVGFGYRWVEERREFAHAAVLVVCTPDGRVSRYLYGVQFDPQTLRLALVEASEGKIGSTIDQILLFCFHYDAREGRYAVAADRLMRAGGAVVVVALGGFLLALWRRDKRRQVQS